MTAPIHDRSVPAARAFPTAPSALGLPRPTRDDRRDAIVHRLLDSLEDLVARHRALAGHADQVDLHAELIAAEVAHELEVTRAALRRNPKLRRTG